MLLLYDGPMKDLQRLYEDAAICEYWLNFMARVQGSCMCENIAKWWDKAGKRCARVALSEPIVLRCIHIVVLGR